MKGSSERCRSVLLDEAEKAKKTPGAPLSSLRLLSARYQLPISTLWRTLQDLIKSGDLVSVQGKGVYPAGLPVPSRKPLRREHRPRAGDVVQRRLKNDILSGSFDRSNTTNSLKSLCRRYEVSYPTLRKALDATVRKGLLLRQGVRYIRSTKPVPPSARIVLVGRLPDAHALFRRYRYGRFVDFFRSLTVILTRSNIAYELCGFTGQENGEAQFTYSNGRRGRKAPADKSVLGYVVLPDIWSDFGILINSLLPYHRPVAYWNEITEPDFTLQDRDAHLLRIFQSSLMPSLGQVVGEYLFNLGHRHVAYFSPFHGHSWSQNRLQGLRNVFCDKRAGGSVDAFVNHEWPETETRILQELASRDPSAMFPRHYADALHLYDRPGDALTLREAGALYLVKALVYQKMKPFFDKAIDNKEITAWVGADDNTAVMALDYLRECGCAIPSTRSVAGFDDTRQSVEAQLTSYNCSADRLPEAMLMHILNYTRRPFGGEIYVRLPGTLMVRGSTGPAPAR